MMMSLGHNPGFSTFSTAVIFERGLDPLLPSAQQAPGLGDLGPCVYRTCLLTQQRQAPALTRSTAFQQVLADAALSEGWSPFLM